MPQPVKNCYKGEEAMSILVELGKGCLTRSAEETRLLARKLAEVIPANTTLAIYGNMGAGKTTFVQGMADYWKIEGPVTSPTFAIYNIYKGMRQLIHLDAYRLEKVSDIRELMLEEFLKPPYCLAIEWPERTPLLLTPETWRLRIIQENETRKICLES